MPWGIATMYQSMVRRKCAERERTFKTITDRIATTDEQVHGDRKRILALSLFELRDALQTDIFTATQVLDAYMFRALEVQSKYNCITECVIESFDVARSLDEKYGKGKSKKPPLFGIPFSVKDNFFMKGYDCTLGLAKYLYQPKQTDCNMVVFLRDMGAVPFVRTNVPQALLSFVCSNTLFGTTTNPHNTDRTCGGSSGGEACLLAADGSPFGIGSDLAGSLRIPATMCGIVSLKPTEDRLKVLNTHPGMPGRGRLGLSFGFFTKSVDEQIFLFKTILVDHFFQLSPQTVPMPFDGAMVESKNTLRIGYFVDDGHLPPTPGCARVVLSTVQRLEAHGHTLVPFKVPAPERMAELLYKNLFPDGGTYFRQSFAHENVDPFMKRFVLMTKIPNCIRWLASILVSRLSPQLAVMSRSYVTNTSELRLTQQHTDDYIQQFTDQWVELQLDALVCPAFVVPPIPNQYPSQLGICCLATGLFNMLDYPAGVVCVDQVTSDDDQKLLNEYPSTIRNRNPIFSLIRKAAQNSVGLPLSVQVVALPYREEMCLRVMKEIELVANRNK